MDREISERLLGSMNPKSKADMINTLVGSIMLDFGRTDVSYQDAGEAMRRLETICVKTMACMYKTAEVIKGEKAAEEWLETIASEIKEASGEVEVEAYPREGADNESTNDQQSNS